MPTDPDPTPLAALKGLTGYNHAVEKYRTSEPLDSLAAIRTAEHGLTSLAAAAAGLARQQGSSWATIGYAMGMSRQSAQARFSSSDPDPSAPGTVPPAQLLADEALDVRAYHRTQTYPVRVWRFANGDLVAIVSEVWGNTSLMNASESVMEAVQERWPGSHVLERWSEDRISGTPARGGRYAWSTGTGGNIDANLDDLARRGLDLR